MSTEHQQYSTNNQMDVIKEYAERRNMEIVTTYSDEGKSGLNIQGRDSLTRMIADVEGKRTDFKCILVYDISRWGRFQDADESAYYEYLCKRAGIAVHYCAEQFENDGSNISTIVKSVKRAMAGEYSRELSVKVFQGACRLIQLGYKQGGPAGFGLRRMLIDQNGQQKTVLKMGEHKSLQTDRVILVPGPPEEVEVVQWMYTAFAEEGKQEAEIAAILNQRGIKTDLNRDWTRGTVHEVLTNEKYIGNNVYHRTSNKLKKKHVNNPPSMWIKAKGVFKAIVDERLFFLAQGIIIARTRHYSDDEMLEKLKGLRERHGRLSGILINEAEEMPSSAAFRNRFGSLIRAYQLIGYDPGIDYAFVEINRHIRQMHPEIVKQVTQSISALGATVVSDRETDLLWINGEFSISLVLCRCHWTQAGVARWRIQLEESLRPDITVAVRLDETNQAIKDYYLLPSLDLHSSRLRFSEDNGFDLDTYRFEDLDFLIGMARRYPVEEVA
jgi:DNA invertase Pin-like site-specific DNA recombinase